MASRVPLPYIVGIAGGSGSGKTSLARAVAETLGPEQVALLAHDVYYRDRSEVPPAARAGLNYDVPEALDQSLFLDHLRALRRGAVIRPPRYCFTTHCRLSPAEPLPPRDVVLVEGILLFCDPHACDQLDLKIYVDAPAFVRLERRIFRDAEERGRTPESVIQQFETTVRTAHERYVEPTKSVADLTLLNIGGLAPLAEIAATVIRSRLAGRQPVARPEAA